MSPTSRTQRLGLTQVCLNLQWPTWGSIGHPEPPPSLCCTAGMLLLPPTLLLLLLMVTVHLVCPATLEPVLWSSSSSQFPPGQGLVLYPQIGDKMDIVCPRSDGSSRGKEEFYRVHLVTLSQLERCIIDKMDTPLLNCDKPHRDVKFTFKFQEFSPNLWGFEFLKGKDYYVTSTSTGSLSGLHNTNGGACRSKSMKLVLRVGQNSSDPASTLQESPSRNPTRRVETKTKDGRAKDQDLRDENEAPENNPNGGSGRKLFLLWIFSGCVAVVFIVVPAFLWLWRHRRQRCAPVGQHIASVSLSTVPKRDSISSDNESSDRSDVMLPLQRPHYKRVSGDYAAPVFMVQEVTPTSKPPNLYYSD